MSADDRRADSELDHGAGASTGAGPTRGPTRPWEWAVLVVFGVLGVFGVAAAAGASGDLPAWSAVGSSLERTDFAALESEEGDARAPSISDAVLPESGVPGRAPNISATVEPPGGGPSVVLSKRFLGGWWVTQWWGSAPCELEPCPPVIDGDALSSSTQVGSWTDPYAVAYATLADDVVGMDVDQDGGCAIDAERCADVFIDGLVDPPHRGRLSIGPGSASSDSTSPSLAADGPTVAFTSQGTGLLPGDVGTSSDVYVATVTGGDVDGLDVELELVSVPGPGGARTGGHAVNGENAISDDGSVVAFSTTDRLVAADVNDGEDVYVRDRDAGTTELVSRLGSGAAVGGSGEAAVSGDGRWVAFASDAVLETGDVNGQRDIYLHDRHAGTTRLVSEVPGGGGGGADGPSVAPVLDGDGSLLAFETRAPRLVHAAEGDDVLGDIPFELPQVMVAHLHDGGVLELLAPARSGYVDATPATHQPDLSGETFIGEGMVVFVSDGDLRSIDPPASGHRRLWTTWTLLWPTCDPEQFSDVGPGPFCAEISVGARDGLVAGYPDGTFRPGELVSRQAMAAFLYRAAGAPGGPDPGCAVAPFPDVPVEHPFCGEIAWLAAEGITTGYADGTFRPAADVSRAAYATFLFRLEGSPEGHACPPSAFPDVTADSPFCEAIRWAEATERVDGYVDGTFRPAAPVSRQAAVAILVGSV